MKFKKLIVGTLATLGLVAGVASAQDASMSKESIAERLKPVGELCLQGEDCGGAAPAAAASGGGSDGKSGEEIYGSVCMACHDTGAAGAPVRGDEAAWSERTSKGFDTLLSHSINGFNAMPARGGNPDLSDEEMRAATAYMVEPVMEVPAQEGGSEQAAAEGGEQAAADDSGANAQEAQQSTAQSDVSAETSADAGQQEQQQAMAQNDADSEQDASADQGGATETAAASAGGSDLPGADKIGTCVACHGQDGHGTSPMYPNLAGQNDTYLANALKAYRAGEREGGMSSVMTPMAAALSDEDIVDIAEYYSQQTP
ncbi:c-type cytochrome [Halomonas sp. GXIMD04776]|uniref:c-type cytochrome n=1 Tax=Halomonas sp. GXIMD04776 TaxID=3415605 RepID=UPI003C9A9856